MNILGVGFLSESSACIVQDGKLIAAVSEERLNRRKNWYGFPEEAIAEVLKIAGLTLPYIDLVATHGRCALTPDLPAFNRHKQAITESGLSEQRKQKLIAHLDKRYNHEAGVFSQRTPNYLHQVASMDRPVKVYAHHQCHAASAYFGSGFNDCLTLTIDGWGEDGSHTLWHCLNGQMKWLAYSSTIDSLGYFYGSITKALGFIPHKHEGKVLGLAAHGGVADGSLYRAIRGMVAVDGDSFAGKIENGLYLPHYDNLPLLRLVRDYSREDVAAAAQRVLEETVCEYVAKLGSAARRLAVAGGIFANVKLNQSIASFPNVEQLYVFPNMGDGGLSVGAAQLAYHERTGTMPTPPTSMYLGHYVTDMEAEGVLTELGLPFRESENIAHDIAELLSRGEVVARVKGRMEFGPRALGNRSILYQATDPSANDWLNKKLGRSEFMPFAPATLIEDAPYMYPEYPDGSDGAYMTRTYDCSRVMKHDSPAAVHVDGTARPQIVDRETAPDLYAILSEYKLKTGLSSIINTSFNMHEEPIVCTAEDAVRTFLASRLKYLAIGNLIVHMDEAPVMRERERAVELV